MSVALFPLRRLFNRWLLADAFIRPSMCVVGAMLNLALLCTLSTCAALLCMLLRSDFSVQAKIRHLLGILIGSLSLVYYSS